MASPTPLAMQGLTSVPVRSMSFWDGITSRVEGYRANQQAKKSGERCFARSLPSRLNCR